MNENFRSWKIRKIFLTKEKKNQYKLVLQINGGNHDAINTEILIMLLKPTSLTLDKDPKLAKTLKLAAQCSLKISELCMHIV